MSPRHTQATPEHDQERSLGDPSARIRSSRPASGIVAYVLLAAGYGWRLVAFRREFLADVADPREAFAFFTFVAASATALMTYLRRG